MNVSQPWHVLRFDLAYSTENVLFGSFSSNNRKIDEEMGNYIFHNCKYLLDSDVEFFWIRSRILSWSSQRKSSKPLIIFISINLTFLKKQSVWYQLGT